MMLKELVGLAGQDAALLAWKKRNKGAVFAGMTVIYGEHGMQTSLRYATPLGKEASFLVQGDRLILQAEHAGRTSFLSKVNVNDVIEPAEAIRIADEQYRKRSKDALKNSITGLTRKGLKSVWHVSYLTGGRNVFRIEIDAKSGSVLSEHYEPLKP